MERWQRFGTRQKLAAVAALVYLLYALTGYFLVSSMARDQIVTQLSDATGRDVTLDEVVFNPLGLSVTARNFAFLDTDGEPFVAFDRFYADFELSSLLRWSWHFDVVELDRPRIRVTQSGPKTFNFDDLLALASEAPDTGAEDDAGGIPVAFSIGELQLAEGDFRFVDRSRAGTHELVLDQVSFEILDFSTRSDGDNGNDYELAITSPGGGRFEWSGRLVLDPLLVKGRLALAGLELTPFADFYADRLRFEIPSGELRLSTDYRIDGSGETPLVVLENGELTLDDLAVRERGAELEALTVPSVRLAGIHLDSAAQTAGAGSLSIESPQVRAVRTQSGVDLATLFLPLAVAEPATGAGDDADGTTPVDEPQPPAANDAQGAEGSQQPEAESEAAAGDGLDEVEVQDSAAMAWRLVLDSFVLDNGTFSLRDNSLLQPGDVTVGPLSLQLDNLHWGDEGRFALSLQTALNEAGDISVAGEGTVTPLDLAFDVTVDALPLLAAEPWVSDAARVDLLAGTASLTGAVQVGEGQQGVSLTATADARVENFDLVEADGSPLSAFQRLAVNGVALDVDQRSVSVEQVVLTGLQLDTHIDEQGRTVAQRVSIPVAAPVHVGETPSWRYRIDSVRLEQGEVLFADQSLTPDFTIGLYRFNGEVRNIDTGASGPSAISLTTDVDKYAALKVNGSLKLLTERPGADITIALSDYEMTSLTPYTGIYVGHAVSKGQLAFDSRLSLNDTLLDSTTDLVANNFYLGEKIESDQAIKAPVKLGLAVLRNKEGVIRLPIKASGDLSDPSVSVSGIILKAIGNVLVKAATSPFSVLSGLAGGESLENLVFEPGSASLGAAMDSQLTTLSNLLADKPGLDLQLAGSWAEADRLALARADLVAATWRGDWPGIDAALADSGFRRRLANHYEDVTGNDVETLATTAASDDEAAAAARAEQISRAAWLALLSRDDAVEPARLAQLASERVVNVKTALIEQHAVDGGRLFLLNRAMADREPVTGVQLGLALD